MTITKMVDKNTLTAEQNIDNEAIFLSFQGGWAYSTIPTT